MTSAEVGAHSATETSLVLSDLPPQTHPQAKAAALSSSAERYAEALRSISKLKQRFSEMESRVSELGEAKVDRTQLDQLRKVVTEQGNYTSPALTRQSGGGSV